MECGKRGTTSKNGAPHPKKPDARIVHGMFETFVSGEGDSDNMVSNLDSDNTKKTETAENCLHYFIF